MSQAHATIAARFLAQARAVPDHVAIDDGLTPVTYGELAAMSAAIAALLDDCAVPIGAPITISFADPSQMIAAMFGCLLRGAAYVPLDPAMGQGWMASVLRAVEPAAVLTDDADITALAQSLGFDAQSFPTVDAVDAGSDMVDRSLPDAPISVLFTSGSTGRPKGVVQSQANVLFHADTLIRELDLDPEARHSLLPPFVFDASTSDIFSTLLSGATLVPARADRLGLPQTAARLRQSAVTHLHMTPSLFRALIAQAQPGDFSAARFVVLGGEPLYAADVTRFRECFPDTCVLINGFGSTESSGFATLYRVPKSYAGAWQEQVPVGPAVPGVTVTVEDDGNEVILKTPHRAIGYWKDQVLTAERFLPDGRLRTGDRGSLDAQGILRLSGRLDRDGKLRGVRIDLAGVEAWLMERTGVRAAACRVTEDGAALEAYLVMQEGGPQDLDVLERAFADSFPAYYQPMLLHQIALLPLTTNNKVDYKALAEAARPIAAARAELADLDLLKRLWRDHCAAEPDADQPFFEAGFTSTTLTRFARALAKRTGRDVPISLFYANPTLNRLLQALADEGPTTALPDPSSRQTARTERQRRLRLQRQDSTTGS